MIYCVHKRCRLWCSNLCNLVDSAPAMMKPWKPRTFPEDWMPLMTARQTKIQATSRDSVIFQFRPPVSSMELVMLRVWRYQK